MVLDSEEFLASCDVSLFASIEEQKMQYQNIWISDLGDGLTTFVMTLDFTIESIKASNCHTIDLILDFQF